MELGGVVGIPDRGSVVLVVFAGSARGGQLRAEPGEIEEVRWFNNEELLVMGDAFALARHWPRPPLKVLSAAVWFLARSSVPMGVATRCSGRCHESANKLRAKHWQISTVCDGGRPRLLLAEFSGHRYGPTEVLQKPFQTPLLHIAKARLHAGSVWTARRSRPGHEVLESACSRPLTLFTSVIWM